MRFNFWTALSILLFVVGVVFYLGMGLTRGRWTDLGVYSLSIALVGFGVFGFMAATLPKPDA
ncbi:MAG: hypothetical protein ACYDDF_04590 [Thermoplasmatota archaeon]